MSEQLTATAPAPAAPQHRRGPVALRKRGFRQLAGAWIFTNVADSALYLVVAVWVKELTGLAVMVLGLTPFVLAGSLGLPTAVTLPAAVAGLALVGLGAPRAVVGFVTVLQRLTPPRLQGRVAAATNIALSLPQTLATMLGAAVIGAVDYRALVAATIVCTFVAGTLAPRARPATT